jgi:hypothetical protein
MTITRLFRYFGRLFFLGLAISLGIAAFFIGIEVLDGRLLAFNADLTREIVYYILYGVTLTMVNAVFFDYVYYRSRMASYKRKFVVGAFGSVALTIAAIFALRIFIHVVLDGQAFDAFWAGEKLQFYVIALMITMLLSVFFHALNFYKRFQEQKVKQSQIIATSASAKFESLKNQIDPHFLFNSLNVLNALIDEDPDRAQKFTTSLSKVYRYVLEQKDKELVDLTEELAFAKTYMDLLTMRFEESLFYTLPDITEHEGKVVPLSLQLLLENTIKHNVVSPSRPLHIRIALEDGYLVVENNLQKKEVLSDRNGVGLQNIVSRYALVTGRGVMITQDKERFAVSIPILTKQISVMENYSEEMDNKYIRAQKKVEEIKGFYGHLAGYVITILALMTVNLTTYPQYLWFLYPALGWGIGVAFHYMSVFGMIPFLGRDWEERKIKEILEKENDKKWN